MLLPNPGSLIHTLRGNLKDVVLPALDKGDAQRQLKASLHLLGRLEKSWDLYSQHVLQDNKDIQTTLTEILQQLSDAEVAEKFKKIKYQLNKHINIIEKIDGLNDPDLMKATHRNIQLQECLQNFESVLSNADIDEKVRLSCFEKLTDLYRRMNMRDLVSVGDELPEG